MKKLFKVGILSALLTGIKMAMGFVIAKLVAVHAGPTGLALLGQVQSVVAGFTGVVNAPVGNGLIRYTAENIDADMETNAKYWRASVQWVLLLLAIIVPLGLLGSEFLAGWLFENTAWSWIIVLITLSLPLSVFGSIVNSVLNGQQRFRRYMLLGMFSVIVSSLIMIVLIVTQNIQGALFSVAIQSGLIGTILLLASFKEPWFKLQYWWGETSATQRKAIGGYVLMATTTALVAPVSLIFIRNMLVSQLGWDQAGQWQAVWKISEVYIGVITIALGTYFLPKLASITGQNNIKREVHSTLKVVLPLVIIIALVIYFSRDIIILILFTDEFTVARDLFAVQLIGDVFKIFAFIYAYPMLSRGATKWFVSTEIFFSVLFVILAWLFIPIFGVEGMPIAYATNYFFYGFMLYFGFNKYSV